MADRIELAAVGCRALAALVASRGKARLFTPVSGAWYLAAGDDLVWAITGSVLPHPRAVVLKQPLCRDWQEGVFAYGERPAWTPTVPTRVNGSLEQLTARSRDLLARMLRTQTPRGLGNLLLGQPPPFPFAAAAPLAAQLAQAVTRSSPDLIAKARALIGLGPGLTPSGDDYIVGICFAAHLRAAAEPGARATVQALRAGLIANMAERTNRISAAFMRDALEGLGLRALHDLCNVLADGNADPLPAALRLVGIGHSSGWDVSSGLFAGLDVAAIS